jgi:CBS domain containing-hemolysin-like protein
MPDPQSNPPGTLSDLTPPRQNTLLKWIKSLAKPAAAENANAPDGNNGANPAYDFITSHERILLSNILKLRELKVINVMVPRANIVAIEVDTSPKELLALVSEKQYSRIPVYRDTLDDVLGTIHAKDVLSAVARGEQPDIKKLITDIPIVSPAMTILNLLLKMRQSSRHMTLVVDEYGGIDGLVTIGNVIEAIVGEIDDEHAVRMKSRSSPVHALTARCWRMPGMPVEEFDNRFGQVLTDEERNVSDTLSGLVFFSGRAHPGARGNHHASHGHAVRSRSMPGRAGLIYSASATSPPCPRRNNNAAPLP